MTSTLDRPTITPGNADTPVVSLSAPTTRKPSWVVAGVVLVGLAALLGAYVFNAATDTIRITVAAQELQPGVPIGAEDLRVVELGQTSQIRAIRPEQQTLILGLAPRAVIPAGTLLNTELFVSNDDVIPAGQVVVGAAFAPGAIPTASLAIGQPVSVLIVADDVPVAGEETGPSGAVRIGTGSIWSVETDADGRSSGDAWLSILISADLETQFAQAAADDRIRLSLVNP